jgi:PAS domain S-box-containing protein
MTVSVSQSYPIPISTVLTPASVSDSARRKQPFVLLSNPVAHTNCFELWAGRLPLACSDPNGSGSLDIGVMVRASRTDVRSTKVGFLVNRSGCSSFGFEVRRWRAVLQKLSEQVKACYQRALDANRKADRTGDAALKADFLEMERHWLVLAWSYQFTERLTDFTAANADWRRRFDERVRTSERPDDERRLQTIIQQGDVNALFERMGLASMVEYSDDAIINKNPHGVITSWNKGAARLFGYLAEEVVGRRLTILAPPERQYEDDVILKLIRRGERIEHYETVRQRKDGRLIEFR